MKKKQIKEVLATKEQITAIEKAIGEPIDSFISKFSNDKDLSVFSQNLYRQLRQAQDLSQKVASTGSYQPLLANQYTKDINLNPLVATSEELEDWLRTPQHYANNLRGLSQYLSYAVGQYRTLLNNTNSSLAFNYILLPNGNYTEEQINSEEFRLDYDRALSTCAKLNIRSQFPRIHLGTLYDGVFYGYINETKQSKTLIQIPSDYCYITAPWAYGWRFAVDLTYFDRMIGISEICIPELGEAYKTFIKAREAGIKGEALAPLQYFPMPVSKTWCFTSDILHSDTVPPFASSMMSALDILSYNKLLKNKLIFELYKVIALKIPMDKDNKKMTLTYDEAKEMLAVIQSQLPENINVYASPFDSEPINTNQVDNLQSIVNLGTDAFGQSSGVPQELMGDTGLKQGTALKFVQDMNFTSSSNSAYIQFQNFVNLQIALNTRCFNFKVLFFGNKVKALEEQTHFAELFRTTNIPPDCYLASLGIEPHQMASHLILGNKLNLKQYMTPIVSAFNSKNVNGGEGRKPKDEADLADGGEMSRDYK